MFKILVIIALVASASSTNIDGSVLLRQFFNAGSSSHSSGLSSSNSSPSPAPSTAPATGPAPAPTCDVDPSCSVAGTPPNDLTKCTDKAAACQTAGAPIAPPCTCVEPPAPAPATPSTGTSSNLEFRPLFQVSSGSRF